MSLPLTAVLLAAASQFLTGEEAYRFAPDEHRDWYVSEYREAQRQAQDEIDRLTVALRRIRNPATRREANDRITAARKAQETLRHNYTPFLPIFDPDELEVGRCVRLIAPAPALKIRQAKVEAVADDALTVSVRKGTVKLAGLGTDGMYRGRMIDLDYRCRVESVERPKGEPAVFTLRVTEDTHPFDIRR